MSFTRSKARKATANHASVEFSSGIGSAGTQSSQNILPPEVFDRQNLKIG